jgi:hypothetical protein
LQALLEGCGSGGGGDYAQTMARRSGTNAAVEMITKVLKKDMVKVLFS